MNPRLPIYLDHQATTPLDPRVLEAMLPYLTKDFGNAASRSHVFGMRAEAAVTEARSAITEAIGAREAEVVFTSGATESNNLAILGAARLHRPKGNHVVTSSIEHNAVLDPCRQLEREGFRVTRLAPDPTGLTTAESVAAALAPETILVSIMAANNEIGTLNPIAEIGRVCKARGILFHTDAAQAFGHVPLDVHAMAIDLMSLSAHKLYGPKGIGALFVRASNPRVRLEPLFHGGGHERGLRPGTPNVPAIAGFGAAARIAREEMAAGEERIGALRDRLHEGIASRLPGVTRNGPPAPRLAGNLNLSFDGVESDALMMAIRDIAVSSGSACTSASLEPSHVLRGIGVPEARAKGSIRFGLGRFTTQGEVDYAVGRVVESVERLRAERPTAVA